MKNTSQSVEDWVQRVVKCTNSSDAYGVCLKIPNPLLVPALHKLYEIRRLKDTYFSGDVASERLKKLDRLCSKYDKDSFNDDIRRLGISMVFFPAKINYVVKLWEDKINNSQDFFEQFKYFLGVWCYSKFSTRVDAPTEGIGKVDMRVHFPQEESKRLLELAREKMRASKKPERQEDANIQKLCLRLESKDKTIWEYALVESRLILLSKYPNTIPDDTTMEILAKIETILTRNPHWRSQMHGDYDPRY